MTDYGQNVLRIVIQVVFPRELLHVHLFTLVVLDECLVHIFDQLLVLQDSILNERVKPAGLVKVLLANLEAHGWRSCSDFALIISKLEYVVNYALNVRRVSFLLVLKLQCLVTFFEDDD